MHCKSFSHFSNKKYWHISYINVWNFNEMLTNDNVSFEQLGPDKKKRDQKQSRNRQARQTIPACFWSSLINLILTLLHSERSKLYVVLAVLNAIGLKDTNTIFYLSCIIRRWYSIKSIKHQNLLMS